MFKITGDDIYFEGWKIATFCKLPATIRDEVQAELLSAGEPFGGPYFCDSCGVEVRHDDDEG